MRDGARLRIASRVTSAVGVSNFNASLLRRLLRVARVKPAVVQNAFSVAGHPPAHEGAASPCQEGAPLYGSDMETLALCRKKKIAFSAYSPLCAARRSWRSRARVPACPCGRPPPKT